MYRKIIIAILLLAFLGCIVLSRQKEPIFLIKRVKVVAPFIHLEPKVLQNIIRPCVGQGFFGLNSVKLREQLMQLPWVHAVFIQRIWPDKIIVRLEEENPVAKWNDTALFNAYGKVFIPDKTTFPPDLPLINGPEERAKDIFESYRAMQKMLDSINYKITNLNVDQHNFWRLKLNDDLAVIVGQKNILTRLELFVKGFPKIRDSSEKIAKTVDLRYKNGMAVEFGDCHSGASNNTPRNPGHVGC